MTYRSAILVVAGLWLGSTGCTHERGYDERQASEIAEQVLAGETYEGDAFSMHFESPTRLVIERNYRFSTLVALLVLVLVVVAAALVLFVDTMSVFDGMGLAAAVITLVVIVWAGWSMGGREGSWEVILTSEGVVVNGSSWVDHRQVRFGPWEVDHLRSVCFSFGEDNLCGVYGYDPVEPTRLRWTLVETHQGTVDDTMATELHAVVHVIASMIEVRVEHP